MISSTVTTSPAPQTPQATPLRRTSTDGSLRSHARTLSVASRSSSASSIMFSDGEVDVVTEEGLYHATSRLEARRYKSATFAADLLDILAALRVNNWFDSGIDPSQVKVEKVAGSLTNAVFFISCPSLNDVPTLLLRIYGPSSGELISRPRELHTLHVLSSQYRIGPRVFGTFENGRVEEYFDSVTLTAADLRNPQLSRWIGARMAELHFVDIAEIEDISEEDEQAGRGRDIGARKNVRSWVIPAREVLALPSFKEVDRAALDLDSFMKSWERYMAWLFEAERKIGHSRRVFAHNDTQYGNLLWLKKVKPGTPEHRQIIVVDFEYASPNTAAFDIANHFHEWTANYHSSTPHILDPSRYPSLDERRNFYRAYLEHSLGSPYLASASPSPSFSAEALEHELQRLEAQVHAWSPASHAMWAVWGIVQARTDIEEMATEPEFNYIGYAKCRMEAFRRELRALEL